MTFNETVSISGHITIKVYDEAKNIIHEVDVDNLVVTTGKNHIASRIANILTGEGAVLSHMAIGTSTQAPSSADTSLLSQYSRTALTGLTHTASTNTLTATASFSVAASTSISEAGIFNASSSGTMFSRATFAPFSFGTTTTVALSWTITIN